PAGGHRDADARRLGKALAAIPVRRVDIGEGSVTFASRTERDAISHLNGSILLSGDGAALSAAGELIWRGERVAISLNSALPGTKANEQSLPLDLSVQTPLAAAEFEGEGVAADGLQIKGQLELQIRNLRLFTRWLGLLIPDGRGFGSFSASGPFQWQGTRMAFDEGSFVLDGNRALGTLGLDAGGARPKIDGTLAFTTIALAQYLPHTAPGPAPAAAAPPGSAASPEPKRSLPVDFPILHHLDLDLRLSMTRIVMGALEVGQTAFSVALNSGNLVADFAVLDLCGGTGSGRLAFDAAAPDTQVRLSGHLSGIAAKRCIEAAIEASPLDARTSVIFDLSSSGRSMNSLISNLSGTAMIKARAGSLALDLNALTPETASGAQDPVKLLFGGTTEFAEASGELIFRKDSIYAADLRVLAPPRLFSGDGTIDLKKRTLEFQVVSELAARGAPQEGSTPAASGPPPTVLLSGPWKSPVITVRETQPPAPAQ
ncbi:MAG: AsmA family protein, partial [Alphaproteobacteria bacterium]